MFYTCETSPVDRADFRFITKIIINISCIILQACILYLTDIILIAVEGCTFNNAVKSTCDMIQLYQDITNLSNGVKKR